MDTKNTDVINIFTHPPATAVEAIERILGSAVAMNASDIHCDPLVRCLTIKFRIDGSLEEIGMLPHTMHEEFIARLKIMCGARTDVHAVPQDGRWKAEIGRSSYNIRISFMPTYHGENAVLRILTSDHGGEVTFAGLGFIPDHVACINTALTKSHGLILAVGPTGSGKTTTLHACLTAKLRERISIITLEDPIEYEIPGVRQVHIRHSHGVTFASGLRSVLRQDPDIIMVGEIRDSETARIAIHTALTGHLVFSTLHTNSAIEAITRLADMGVDHYLLASTMRLIIGQRLVRTFCSKCHGMGCQGCRYCGYAGRSIIAEICEIEDELSKLISERRPSNTYKEYVKKKGWRSMLDDGLEKVEWGMTSREEVLKVLEN